MNHDRSIELAKQLHAIGIGDGSIGYIDGAKIPILSGLSLTELIDECGERFSELTKLDDTWMADGGYQVGRGSTREEAVGELLLFLKK